MDISRINDKIDLSEAKWVKDIPFPGFQGVELLVRSANYRPYVKARDKALRADAADGADDEDAFWLAVGGAMADHILLGWKGMTDGGELAEYDPSTAASLLRAFDPHGIGQRFRHGVDWASSRVAADLLAKTETVAGN